MFNSDRGLHAQSLLQCCGLHHFDLDPDQDPTFHSDADPDPILQFDADPDPTTYFSTFLQI